MATSYFQDPFGAADYSAEGMPSLLSLSNLESLGRGSFAGLLGLPEDLRKMLVTKKMQENMDFLSSQSGVPQVPYFLPSSEELKQRTPRMTAPTPQAGLLEDVGAFMSPVPAAAVVPLARGVSKVIKATEGMPVGMSIKDVSPKIGINVNQGGSSFADKIISGEKKFETRESDSLRSYVGKRVGVIRTGEGKAKAIGDVTLGEPIVVSSAEEFAKLRDLHLVPEGSKFDIKEGGVKYLYPIENPVPYGVEKDVAKYGIVSRKILGEPDTLEKAIYPQQAALDLAQQRAALPVEQGGLGLPVTNTAADRAKAMGFEAGWAHGSPNPDITNFIPSKIGAEGKGIYATSYLPEAGEYASQRTGSTVYPLMVNREKSLNVGLDSPYDILNVSNDDALLQALRQRGLNSITSTQQQTPDWLINAGAYEYPKREHFNSVVPENFRSRFAAFDPFRKDVATAAAMGVAAPNLLAAEPKPKEKRRQSSGLLSP
jgi:hypothetical protein